MTPRFEQKIEELESMVEKRLQLCAATWNGLRCRLPADHDQAEPHDFPMDLPSHEPQEYRRL
jgi:hypothetical protein